MKGRGFASPRPAPSHEYRGIAMRSKWEVSYAMWLDRLVERGFIRYWRYERVKFTLGTRSTYTPDFMVVFDEPYLNNIAFIEVKGFRRPTGMTKFRVAAQENPYAPFIMVSMTPSGIDSVLEFNVPASQNFWRLYDELLGRGRG